MLRKLQNKPAGWPDKLVRMSWVLLLMLALAGCGADDAAADGQAADNAGDEMSLTTLTEYGVAPLELTERDMQLLDVVPGAHQHEFMLAEFYAPEQADTLKLSVWSLDENGKWRPDGAVSSRLDNIYNVNEAGRGVLSARWSDDLHDMSVSLEEHSYGTSSSSKGTYNIGSLLDETIDCSYSTMIKNLSQPAEMVLGQPIPLCIISCRRTEDGQENFSLSDYYNTGKFAGSLYVGAVTVTFLDDKGEDQGAAVN